MHEDEFVIEDYLKPLNQDDDSDGMSLVVVGDAGIEVALRGVPRLGDGGRVPAAVRRRVAAEYPTRPGGPRVDVLREVTRGIGFDRWADETGLRADESERQARRRQKIDELKRRVRAIELFMAENEGAETGESLDDDLRAAVEVVLAALTAAGEDSSELLEVLQRTVLGDFLPVSYRQRLATGSSLGLYNGA